MDRGRNRLRSISPEEIEQFIMQHCPQEGWKDSKKVKPWLNGMMVNGCIETFTEDGAKISVVLCSRMIEGECLVIDLLLSTRDNILKSIAAHLKEKYGSPKSVHWKRGEQQTTALAKRLEKMLLPQ